MPKPVPLSMYLRRHTNLSFPCSLPVLHELCSGLFPGKIVELCGPSNVGKSRICYRVIEDCLCAGKECLVITNKTIPRRILKSFSRPENLSITFVSNIQELLTAMAITLSRTKSLIFIDGIQSILQTVLGIENYKGLVLLNEVKCMLGRISEFSLVLYTNGIVSIRNGTHGPALGASWESAPTVRLMVVTEDEKVLIWREKTHPAEMTSDAEGKISISWCKNGSKKLQLIQMDSVSGKTRAVRRT